ncbi:hypothetical protein [Halomicrococcus sp. NG-SE-24]|uniref:hypothetical protein n=1 Tax=Halomicrococcus sp. NG-SE-24 TaxID=3436928 RepID=UPI003D9647F4
MAGLDELLGDPERNATLAWLLVAAAVFAMVESALSDEPVWAGFVGVAVVVLVLPSLVVRDPSVTLPWEVIALAVLPALARTFGPESLANAATHLGVAALALALVVELSAFTSAELAPWFAVVLVAMTTMAAAGTWAVVQFHADQWLGTNYIRSQDGLMWDLVAATASGVVAGGLFELYFRRRASIDARAPDALGGGE